MPRSFAFGPFVLIPERQLLLEGKNPVRIGGRALALLTALVEHSGQLVDKRALMALAWPDTVVDESNLKVNIGALRRALGDGGSHDARYIVTVTGRGYQFVAPVTKAASPDLAATSTTTARRHNLPIGTTRILGRADAIDTIRSELETSRLVTIVGTGGIGKTTVALAVAERALEAFADGVWLVDLGVLKDPSLVPHAIANALGLVVNTPNVLVELHDFLRERELLLVLDSCEHLIEVAAPCASRILVEATRVKVLATSREPLTQRGELVHPLPALGTPPGSALLSAREALAFPAVQLFVDRASDRLESFELSDDDAPTVAEICRRLDGLALAIELAATRIDAFGVGGLLQQLDDGLPLLVGRRAGPERHRTLTATLDWSYGLLPVDESAVLRAVSVFARVFDIDAAAVVSGGTPAEAGETLAQLAAKSLLATNLSADAAAYRLLETTRVYCLQRLLQSGDDASIRRRHAEHVCGMLERGQNEWGLRSAAQWESTYGRVLDDLRAALAWAGGDPGTRALAIRLTVAGLLLWNHFSLLEECRVHVSSAIEKLDGAGLVGSAFEMHLQVWLGGSTMFTRGLTPLAIDATRRALELALQLDDTESQLRCLRTIGLFQHLTGDHAAGLGTFETFVSLAALRGSHSSPDGETQVSISEFFVGRLPSARRRVERLRANASKEASARQTIRYQSDVYCTMGCVASIVEWLTGSPDTGALSAQSTIDYALGTRHHLTVNDALAASCPVFYLSGRFHDCARSIELLDELGARHGISTRRPIAMFFHAALSRAEGRPADAIESLERAIAAFRSIKHMARMPFYLSVVADTLRDIGDFERAHSAAAEALALAQAQSEGWCHPEVLRVQASVLAARGEADAAEATYLESVALAQRIGALSWRLRAAHSLAGLWSSQSRTDEAYALLRPTYDEFSEGFQTPDLVAANRLLGSLAPANSGAASDPGGR
jgi:predicted ATPase